MDRNDLLTLFESSSRASGIKVQGECAHGNKDGVRGNGKGGGESGRKDGNRADGSTSRGRGGHTGGKGMGDSVLQVMLRTHERQYAGVCVCVSLLFGDACVNEVVWSVRDLFVKRGENKS